MSTKTLTRTAAVIAGMFVPAAWACYPAPDFKPTHEITVIELSQHLAAPVVVFKSEDFALHVTAEDLLVELSKSYMAVATLGDLQNALRARMPLAENLQTQDLVAALFPPPAPGATEHIQGQYLGNIMQAKHKLSYAFASVLQKKRAVVFDTLARSTLTRIKLDTFKEICHGGRLFMSADGTEILRIVDWIS